MLAAIHDERILEAREARYADRPSPVVDFLRAADVEVAAIVRFELERANMSLSPADLYEDYNFDPLNHAFATMAISTPENAALAASDLREAIFFVFKESPKPGFFYDWALRHLHNEARRMLIQRARPPSRAH